VEGRRHVVTDAEVPAVDDADDWGDGAADAGQAHTVLAYLAAQLTDEPDAVQIEAEASRRGTRLSLRVASDDMGRIIGRRGRVAQAIRTVVRAAAAAEGRDVSVDIVD
jgi:predicted RNA-binding protein YlqC (UPF0109 family)